MIMMTAVIVDDEAKSRETIQKMIALYCKNISLVGEAEDVISAFEVINRLKPDLLFLDIKLKNKTGFDLLKFFESIDFKIIFITAFDEFAIKAFKFSAVDYILKPVCPDDLIAAVDKVEKLHQKEEFNKTLGALLNNMEQKKHEQKKMILRTAENIHVIELCNIIRCEADQNYTIFHLSDGKKIMVSQTLKEYDELLDGCDFFRVHQSHLVNIRFIDHFVKGDGGYLIMKDKSSVPVSYRKKDQLLTLFDNLSL
jgi:two-component system, LytTR family, response regulator